MKGECQENKIYSCFKASLDRLSKEESESFIASSSSKHSLFSIGKYSIGTVSILIKDLRQKKNWWSSYTEASVQSNVSRKYEYEHDCVVHLCQLELQGSNHQTKTINSSFVSNNILSKLKQPFQLNIFLWTSMFTIVLIWWMIHLLSPFDNLSREGLKQD